MFFIIEPIIVFVFVIADRCSFTGQMIENIFRYFNIYVGIYVSIYG